jgi:hypothetical protein
MSGVFAFGSALRNFQDLQQKAARPEQLDALTVLDTAGNVGAQSQQRKTEAAETAAKAPQPKITLDLVTGTMDATGVPLVSPADQVKQAESAPYMKYAESLKKVLDQSGRVAESLPDPEGSDIDQRLATREGRVALAHEIGIDEPGFIGSRGIMPMIAHKRKFEELLGDSDTLRRAIVAHRLKNRLDTLKEGNEAFRDLASVQNQERLTKAAEHQEISSEAQLVDHLTNRNPLGYESAEDQQKAMETVLHRPLSDGEQAQVHAARAEALRGRDIENTKLELQKAKDARDEKRISIAEERLQSLEQQQQGKTLTDADADYIIDNKAKDATLFSSLTPTERAQVVKRMRVRGTEVQTVYTPGGADGAVEE